MEKDILLQYGIEASKIERITDSLFRVQYNGRYFALKRSSSSFSETDLWRNVHHDAASGHMRGVLPIYMTAWGSATVVMNEELYYLTPWIEARSSEPALLYETIGYIHGRTKQQVMLNTSAWLESIKVYKLEVQEGRKALLQAIEQFESRHFMSPFELSCCTQYAEADRAFEELIRQLDLIINMLGKNPVWQTSITHGNMTSDHFLNGTTPMFSNWEQVQRRNATSDLFIYFQSEMAGSLSFSNRDSYLGTFKTYMQQNKLTSLERSYLAICLLDPRAYLTYIQKQISGPRYNSMIGSVKVLNEMFRVMMFGLSWVHYCSEIFAIESYREHSDPPQVKGEEEASEEAEQ